MQYEALRQRDTSNFLLISIPVLSIHLNEYVIVLNTRASNQLVTVTIFSSSFFEIRCVFCYQRFQNKDANNKQQRKRQNEKLKQKNKNHKKNLKAVQQKKKTRKQLNNESETTTTTNKKFSHFYQLTSPFPSPSLPLSTPSSPSS